MSDEMKIATALGMVDGSASQYVLNRWMLGGRKCGQKAKEKTSSTGPKGTDDKEEARMLSRQAVKPLAKRPPMALEAEANTALAKRR